MPSYHVDVSGPEHVTASLADLLADATLGLALVAGPADARYSALRWPAREADRPWLAPGDLRIVVAGGADDLAGPAPTTELERALRPPPAVLLYALTPTERKLPPSLAGRPRLAGRLLPAGTALVTSPPAVAPELVARAALRALVRATTGAGLALGAPQAHLLAGLEAAKPERDLLERLHDLTGTDLVFLSAWGDVVARAGAGNWRPRAGAAGAPPVAAWGEGEVRLGGRPALLLHVMQAGRRRGTLLAFDAPGWARPWLEFTRTLLAAAAAMAAAETRAETAGAGALLSAWLAGPAGAERLAPLLARAGFGGGAPYRVGVAEVPRGGAGAQAHARPGADAAAERVREAVEEYFRQRGLSALTGAASDAASGAVTWLAAAPGQGAEADTVGTDLLAATRAALGAPAAAGAGSGAPGRSGVETRGAAPGQATVRIGLSRTHTALGAAARAEREARLALAGAPAGGVATFDELDPVAWLVERPAADLALARERVIGPLLAADRHGKLMVTLAAYLAGPTDPAALAARLGVHVNTLRNRLRRIEELVGAPLANPETIARLWLVTRPPP